MCYIKTSVIAGSEQGRVMLLAQSAPPAPKCRKKPHTKAVELMCSPRKREGCQINLDVWRKVIMTLRAKASIWTVMGKDLDSHPVVGFSVNKFSSWKPLSPKCLSRLQFSVMLLAKCLFFCVNFMVKSNWGNEVGQKTDLKRSNLQKESRKHVSERKELCPRRAGCRLRKALRTKRRAIHKEKC